MFMLQVFWDSPDQSHCGNNANILATFQCVMPVWFSHHFRLLFSVIQFVVAVGVCLVMCHVVGSLFIVLFLLFIIAGQISNFTVMCEISSFKFVHDGFFWRACLSTVLAKEECFQGHTVCLVWKWTCCCWDDCSCSIWLQAGTVDLGQKFWQCGRVKIQKNKLGSWTHFQQNNLLRYIINIIEQFLNTPESLWRLMSWVSSHGQPSEADGGFVGVPVHSFASLCECVLKPPWKT